MNGTEEKTRPVRSRAVIIEPVNFKVIWMNGSARGECPEVDPDIEGGVPIEKAVPMADLLGVKKVIPIVSETGIPRQLHTGIIKTRKGTMELVASVDRLPDGKLLLLMENTYQFKEKAADRISFRRGHRRI